jgi:hypothetical protein
VVALSHCFSSDIRSFEGGIISRQQGSTRSNDTPTSLRLFNLICLPSGPCISHAQRSTICNSEYARAHIPTYNAYACKAVRLPTFRLKPSTRILYARSTVHTSGIREGCAADTGLWIVDCVQAVRNFYHLTSPHPIASSLLIILTVIALSHALAHLALPRIEAREPCRALIAMPCHDVTTIASHASPSRRPCSTLLYGGGIPPRFSSSF